MAGFVFGVASIIAIVSAIMCITRKSPVASALWLVSVMFQLAVLYVLLDAQFLAAVQVLVYAGAIMVLFLFVIMLLNIGRPGPDDMKVGVGRIVAFVLGLLLIAELVGLRSVTLPRNGSLPEGTIARMVEQQGPLHAVATPLFQQYLIPFEITSVMLLAALVGGVVLAKRKLQ
jgi:NADH-quinone oxidoreductase subunit J